MKKYMRMQEVMAEPMNLKEYEKKTGNNPLKDQVGNSDYPGYMVMNGAGFGRWMKKEVFESQFAPCETFIERMEIELAQVADRLEKLGAFMEGEKFKQLGKMEQTLRYLQHNAMQSYAFVLDSLIGMHKGGK